MSRVSLNNKTYICLYYASDHPDSICISSNKYAFQKRREYSLIQLNYYDDERVFSAANAQMRLLGPYRACVHVWLSLPPHLT